MFPLTIGSSDVKGRKQEGGAHCSLSSAAEQHAIFGYLFADRLKGEDQTLSEPAGHRAVFTFLSADTFEARRDRPAEKDRHLSRGRHRSVFGSKTRFTSTHSTRKLSITGTMKQIIDERWEAALAPAITLLPGAATSPPPGWHSKLITKN